MIILSGYMCSNCSEIFKELIPMDLAVSIKAIIWPSIQTIRKKAGLLFHIRLAGI